MRKEPQISVVMSVFNNETELAEAIESILNQSHTNLELIIINDASTDNSLAIINTYCQQDERVRLINNDENLKLAASLNKGIAIARGDYIARMDADDFSFPERLSIQYDFMNKNTDIAVCGAWVELYESPQIVWKTAITSEAARCAAFFESCFHHPTVMIRKSVLDEFGAYDEAISTAQDCHLWSKLTFDHGQKLVNIPQVLLRYRSHPEKERDQYRADQHDKATKLRKQNVLRMHITPDDQQYVYHDLLCRAKPVDDIAQLKSIITWIEYLESMNVKAGLLDIVSFKNELNSKFLGVCLASASVSSLVGVYYLKRCWKSDTLKNLYRFIRISLSFFKSAKTVSPQGE